MHPICALSAAFAAFVALAALPSTTHATESYDNCTGFIDVLPATIGTQGVWCLKQNLSTAVTSGNAITIGTNNVTIDCNGFKLGGLAAGDSSGATGIHAQNRQNVTVRHCGIRGFYWGVLLSGGAGHLVEDNRLDQNLYTGIHVTGDNNRVQRNQIYDTGGYTGGTGGYGINADADIIDNIVAGVFGTLDDNFPHGIEVSGDGNEVRGNHVRRLESVGGGLATGIRVVGTNVRLTDNHVTLFTPTAGKGIDGWGANTFCTGNTVLNFETAYDGCEHSFANLPAP